MPEEKRVYLDECGVCHNLQRTHGYSPIGQPIHGLTYGKRKGRTNVIGAWSPGQGLFATQTYSCTINKPTFIDGLKQHLLPLLHKGNGVIMDNAPWHKGTDIETLIASTGALLLKLPPYSPDFNPIEHAWVTLKSNIKKASITCPDIIQNIHHHINCARTSKSD
jgi:transposase